MRAFRATLAIVIGAMGVACLPSLDPIEAWSMTITRVRECTLVSPGAPQCAAEDDLAARTTKGRWVFEHGAAESFSVTLEGGSTLAGIYFADDGTSFEEPEAPCFGNGGICYFARDRFTVADGDEGCRSGGERKLVARLSEEDDERKLEAVVSDVVQEVEVVDGSCTLLSQRDAIDGGTGVFEPARSLARTEVAEPAEDDE